ncbi:MAG TPA: hypothetical protein VKI19_06375 [Acidimicrobiales bacterium]|nr:hypothetical protein [Acidimicrobiales bacterium]
MTDVSIPVDESAQLEYAVKLLQLRQASAGNAFKSLAIEKRLKLIPEGVMRNAEKQHKKGPKKSSSSKGPVRATLKSATLTTTAMQAGHEMTFDMLIDVPKGVKAATSGAGEDLFARDFYGAFFEWWEEIIVHYDFSEAKVDGDQTARDNRIEQRMAAGEGGSEKPWSDIYLSNPQSQTFYSWKGGLEKASAGKIEPGPINLNVQDRPAVQVRDDRFSRRTLRFRINAGDAGGVKWKGDAIQVLEIYDGVLSHSLYQDSTGAKLEAGEGKAEIMRYRSNVDVEVSHNEGSDFVVALESDKSKCANFDNLELDQILKAVEAEKADLISVHKDVNQSNRMNAVPLIPSSDEYWQRDASDGGLLVGHLSGGKVKRLFHTDKESRDLEVRVNGKPMTFTVRTFEQLPL